MTRSEFWRRFRLGPADPGVAAERLRHPDDRQRHVGNPLYSDYYATAWLGVGWCCCS